MCVLFEQLGDQRRSKEISKVEVAKDSRDKAVIGQNVTSRASGWSVLLSMLEVHGRGDPVEEAWRA